MSLKQKPVLFLDLQTTGAKPGSAHILEAAWSSSRSGEFETFLVAQPEGEPVPRRIQYLTGIYEKDMAEAKSYQEVFASLAAFIKTHCDEDPLAVIHFAQFEKPFLTDIYAKLEREQPFRILCTHEIAKRLFPNLPARGIKGLAGYFGCPSSELKRAANHLFATQTIWEGLLKTLEEKNVTTLTELDQWLTATPKASRTKYEYPLPKEKRLALPKQPGIYRMVSQWGEVLYVGKATSLHDRVNSYFRGQKNRDSRKLEMLTQVYDLHVTPVGSPLEAALLETDEIKRLNPRYNVSLKVGRRELAFFNRDFSSLSTQADEIHCIGPFSNALALDSLLKLGRSVREGQFDENMFYEPIEARLLEEGFDLFCARHGFDKVKFGSIRSILAVGLNWYRQLEEKIEEEAPDDDQELAEGPTSPPPDSKLEDEEEIEVLTAEDLADKFERHFIRSAAAYIRTRELTRLLNADIFIESKNSFTLRTRQGQLVNEPTENNLRSQWIDLSVDTYDRMTVLYSELNKLRSRKDHLVKVIYSINEQCLLKTKPVLTGNPLVFAETFV